MKGVVLVVDALPTSWPIGIRPEDVVVREHVGKSECLGALCERANLTGIRSDIVTGKDDTKFHTRRSVSDGVFD